jgi:hypothetical protein
MMNTSINGFYAVYLTGSGGQGFTMLVIRNGTIVGADVAGGKYDGTYNETETGFAVRIAVSIPPNIHLIQGVSSGLESDTSDLDFHLSVDFLSQPFIRINTKHGPVNAKLVKLRELND